MARYGRFDRQFVFSFRAGALNRVKKRQRKVYSLRVPDRIRTRVAAGKENEKLVSYWNDATRVAPKIAFGHGWRIVFDHNYTLEFSCICDRKASCEAQTLGCKLQILGSHGPLNPNLPRLFRTFSV